ncbi:MAG: hypothetical protein H6540_01910 [Bacteroidales bacterium]|nr:hypothetical protein [Bacteroidales bacterium]MCB9013901.1 hypothetical protein [Bacteroidales bacterium]
MKTKLFTVSMLILFMMVISFSSLSAQEEEKESPFSVGADIVSSYVWRGSKIGNGPNIQPALSFSSGGFTIGSWGSYSFLDFGDVSETDLYASYGFDFGLSLGLTDYYYQGSKFFDYTDSTGSHAFEINLGYALNDLSISANYILNDASQGGPANKPGGGDMYFELGYSFTNFDVFLGAGNGWHTTYDANGDDVFAVCNIGIKTSKEIKFSDSFSLPVSGALSVNPDKEELNLVVGFSF